MKNQDLNAQDIFNIIQEIISDISLDRKEIANTLEYFFSEESDSKSNEKLKEVMNKLRSVRVEMAQLVIEALSYGDGKDIIEDNENDILLYIFRINEALDECERYLYEVLNEKGEEDIEEDSESIFSKPKIAFFSNAAINELESIPDEEKEGFLVILGYIKNGGARLNYQVKRLTSLKKKNVLEYKNTTGQARIFAYRITKNIIYVVKMTLKKDDWPMSIRKSINKKKPTDGYTSMLIQKSATKAGLKELREISNGQMEELKKMIEQASKQVVERGKEFYREEAICTINGLLGTEITMDDFEDDSEVIDSAFERIYSLLKKCMSVTGDTEDIYFKYNCVKSIEKNLSTVIRSLLIEKEEINDIEKGIIALSEETEQNEQKEVEVINRETLFSERRIIYMINYLRENIDCLKKAERKIILSRR